MHEIICPHCSKAFKIDEAGYADILQQVRDDAFEQQLHERLALAEQDKRSAVELATRCRWPARCSVTAAAKDAEIQGLKARLDAGEVARKLAVAEALGAVENSATPSPTSWPRPGTTSWPPPSWPRPCWPTSCKRQQPRRTPRSRA